MFALPLRELLPLRRLLCALPARGRFCLDGDAAHPEGRWTFLGAEPVEVVELPFGARDPLDALDGRGAPGDGGGPLGAADIPRWIVALAYDATWSDPGAFGVRRAARLARTEPVLWMGRYESLLAVDERGGRGWALAEHAADAEALRARVERAAASHDVASEGAEADDAARDAVGDGAVGDGAVDDGAVDDGAVDDGAVGDGAVDDGAVGDGAVGDGAVGDGAVATPRAEDPRRHAVRIEAALDAIGRGDIYQVNLARPWRVPDAGDPLALWRAMRRQSAVPLGLLLQMGERALVARTMERFLRWDRAEGRLWTSPIKGTLARRGDDAGEARALARDPKERAEHAMIVDLMRNDLSRVARTGSVRVREPLRVEPFRGLHHLVSTVTCETRAGVGAAEVARATFPPGSVTGTPKLRAIELIEQLEDTPRGFYTGALGFLDRAGGLSLAVAIRTATVGGGEARYFAGGGLVSASVTDREIAETELKARVFLEAITRMRERKPV